MDLKPFNLMDIGSSEAGQPVFTASENGMVYTSVLSTEEFTIRFHNPDGTELSPLKSPSRGSGRHRKRWRLSVSTSTTSSEATALRRK